MHNFRLHANWLQSSNHGFNVCHASQVKRIRVEKLVYNDTLSFSIHGTEKHRQNIDRTCCPSQVVDVFLCMCSPSLLFPAIPIMTTRTVPDMDAFANQPVVIDNVSEQQQHTQYNVHKADH